MSSDNAVGLDTLTQPRSAFARSGVREYQALCLLALGTVFFVDLQQGGTLLSMLLLGIGLFGVVSRRRIGPVLFLLVLAGTQWAKQFAWRRYAATPLPAPRSGLLANDLCMSMAVLAFILAQYRLQSLAVNILPADPNLRSGPRRWLIFRPAITLVRRPGHLVTPTEVGWLLLSLALCALAAQIFWNVLFLPPNLLELPSGMARLVYFGWELGIALLVTAGVLALWRCRKRPPQIAALYLQDILWRETRGEQRRLNRWIAWWRIRKKR